LVQLDKVDVKGYPWNFEIPGKGSFKIDPEMVRDYKAGYDKLTEHGWLNWSSCNPYLNTRIPKMGEYCASSESSAACYINTVLGARTNRESPVNTVYCAYTGCLPKYGSHLDENRAAKCIVELDDEVRDNVKGMADWGALGACIAAKAGNRIMAVLNLPITKMTSGATKNLISCASPGMNDPILHLMGITPESPTLEAAFKGKMPKNPERFTVTMDDIIEMYRYLNNLAPAPGPERAKPVDIVIVGCPHATFDEVREIARLVKGGRSSRACSFGCRPTRQPTSWLSITAIPRASRTPAARSTTRPACVCSRSGTSRRTAPSPRAASSTRSCAPALGRRGQPGSTPTRRPSSMRRSMACSNRPRAGITGASHGRSGWPAKRQAAV
jgi:hypothetical protein